MGRPTTVVNIKTQDYDVYIGRPSIFGNPFRLEKEEDRPLILQQFKEYFYNRIERDEAFRNRVELECTGQKIGCYCHPLACHGDVIAEWCDAERKL